MSPKGEAWILMHIQLRTLHALALLKDELDWGYLREIDREFRLNLKAFLLKSFERLPISLNNPVKVRKELRRMIEGFL
ncbi:MAG: hypothetical protein QXV05_04770 [Candidatus Korarchaeum sp.]